MFWISLCLSVFFFLLWVLRACWPFSFIYKCFIRYRGKVYVIWLMQRPGFIYNLRPFTVCLHAFMSSLHYPVTIKAKKISVVELRHDGTTDPWFEPSLFLHSSHHHNNPLNPASLWFNTAGVICRCRAGVSAQHLHAPPQLDYFFFSACHFLLSLIPNKRFFCDCPNLDLSGEAIFPVYKFCIKSKEGRKRLKSPHGCLYITAMRG